MFNRDEARHHSPLSGLDKGKILFIGAAVVVTAPIWGPIYLVKKGVEKIKEKIRK